LSGKNTGRRELEHASSSQRDNNQINSIQFKVNFKCPKLLLVLGINYSDIAEKIKY
jgi:hypothetical protein